VLRSGEHERKAASQDMPCWPPVDAGGFHRHMSAGMRREPLGKRQSLLVVEEPRVS
jgi:hypothetical protein